MEMSALHWIRPAWLYLIPLVWLVTIFIWRQHKAGGDWARFADPQLLKFLGGSLQKGRHKMTALMVTGLTLALLALAGPAWEQAANGSYSANQARVVVLDLSYSMQAEDVKPSRLAQARFKLMDMLDLVTEGQVGLVAFAGQAFVIAPLSSDMETIKNMVPALSPDIMPAPGSRPDEALALAATLIQQAGFTGGEILLMGDSSDQRAIAMASRLADQGFTTSVLGIGTSQGAPIPSGRGFIKDREGKIVVSRLEENNLRELADLGDGRYLATRPDNSELAELLGQGSDDFIATDEDNYNGIEERWLDQGYWLLLLLLPIVLVSFRRGWLFILPLFILPNLVPVAHAQVLTDSPPAISVEGAEAVVEGVDLDPLPAGAIANTWRKLWWNADQRSQQALQAHNYESAEQARSPRFKAEALYRQGEFLQAMEYWKALENTADTNHQRAEAAYNLGNAFAAQNELDEAIAAYNRALTLEPDNKDAQINRDLLENLKNQEQEEGEENQEEGEQGENQKQQDQENQQNQESEESESSESPAADDESDESPETEEEEEQAPEQQQSEEESIEEQALEMTQEEQWTEEDEQAKEQWLRRIPDDPGGLLRRKLIQEYKRREAKQAPKQVW